MACLSGHLMWLALSSYGFSLKMEHICLSSEREDKMMHALVKQYKIKERITKLQNAKEYTPFVLELQSIKLKKNAPENLIPVNASEFLSLLCFIMEKI